MRKEKLSIEVTTKKKSISLKLTGHASYHGENSALCAGISAIILFFIKSGTKMGINFKKAIVEKGKAELLWEIPEEETLKQFSDSLINSLEEIAKENPEAIDFRKK